MSKVDGHNRFFVTACAGFFVLLALIGIQALFDAEKNSAKLLPAPSSHATQSISSADRELLELTEAETNYLAQLGTITVCPDPDWIPFEHVDESGNFTGIASISQRERDEIINRHINITVVNPIDYGPLAYVTFLFAALIAVSLFWNYKLNNTYRALNESERSKSVLLANLPGIAYRCHDDEQWTMEFISDGCQKLTGYPSSDFIDNRRISYNEVIHNDDREWVRAAWNKAKEAKKDSINLTYRIITADKEVKWVFEQGMFIYDENASIAALEGLVIDISDQKNAEKEREELLSRLQKSLAEVKTLRGIVPICASCKNIRDDAGFWNRVETYVSQHTGAEFSHSICPNCMKKLYPEYCEKCESTDKKQPNES